MHVKKSIFIFIIIIFFWGVLLAQGMEKTIFQGYEGCFVMDQLASGKKESMNLKRCGMPEVPCSTFKIYTTLMGLELGLIQGPDTPWYTWDGITRSMSDWNKNLTLREAFRVSAVPAYQELVRHIGKERMKDFLEKLNYGTKDMSAGLDCFWLSPSHSIKISADQQVELLKMLLQGKLPFSSRNIAILRDVMHYKKTDKGILYGKTGTGVDEKGNYQIGWYVGFVESEHTTYVFACNIIGGEKPMGRTARAIVEEILKQKGIL